MSGRREHRAALPRRALGSSGLKVSVFSLGSWRTFERITHEQGLAVMRRARDLGINFLDDARYNDETGTAPIPSGYSEVIFGELFRATGWDRDEVVVANKLWWEYWPDQNATEELDASLGRMELDHVDLIYATPVPEDLAVADAVAAIGGLIDSGRARAWGVGNWTGAQLTDALDQAAAQGVPPPCAAQLPYSLVSREMVNDPTMAEVLAADVGLVASYVLAGGTLTGKYLRGEPGRATGDDNPAIAAGNEVAVALSELAQEWEVTPASLAFCFALSHPDLASILFGATSEDQVEENIASLQVFESLDKSQLAALAALGGASS